MNFRLDPQVISVTLLVVAFSLLILSYLVWKIRAQFLSLTKGSKKGNLEQILEKVLKTEEANTHSLVEIKEEIKNIKGELPSFIQKVGLVRFNPYKEVGGDQSFALSVLDNSGNGVVISALHSRGSTRMYAKPVREGKETKYTLSEEEKEAVKIAKRV